MMRGLAAAVFAACAVTILALGCRQIVGISDRTTAAQTCGLSLPPGDCSSCVWNKCCAESQACNAIPVCQSIEGCYATCAGDLGCTRNCVTDFPPGPLPQYVNLEACISASCAPECGLTCGARPDYGNGDAGEACEECYSNNACAASQACGQSAACLTVLNCETACPTLDCAIACENDNDAGTSLFVAAGNALSGCDSICNSGQNLTCVGHVAWPLPTTSANTLSVGLVDPITSAPLVGVDAKLCSKLEPTCTVPLDAQTSDATGTLHFSYTIDARFGGLDGFIETSGAGLEPTLFFWNFPLSVQNASLAVINVLSQQELADVAAAAKVTILPGYGHIGVAAFDCAHAGAAGVTVTVTPSDANTKTLYGANGSGYSFGTGETGESGIAFVTNVPPGPVELSVTSAASGMTISRVAFDVVDGGIDQVFAVPTPQ